MAATSGLTQRTDLTGGHPIAQTLLSKGVSMSPKHPSAPPTQKGERKRRDGREEELEAEDVVLWTA